MIYLSVCSGIEAATVAWHPLGWTPHAFAEIEAFPSAVLAHHYPAVPNYGDMTAFKDWPNATLDVLVGGTPCQSFSVAGLRGGLADPRGNLMLTYLALTDRYRPRWVVWENVPGVLSSNGGRDFGTFLGALGVLGYGFAYRVLDAQYFGLAQRRKRVFVVGYLGDWRRAAAVLFERESLSGHPAPRRETGQRIAPTIKARATAGGAGWGTDFMTGGGLAEVANSLAANAGRCQVEQTYVPDIVPQAMSSKWSKGSSGPAGDEVANLVATSPFTLAIRGLGDSHDLEFRQDGPLDTDWHTMAVAFHENQRAELTTNDTAGSLKVGGGKPGQGYPAVQSGMQVRRLTPLECERLQGFPDDYTLVTYRGKPSADGPRYKALGNSMAVPCMSWIGRRIAMVDALSPETPQEGATAS